MRKRDQERILQTGWCPPAPSPVGCCAETLDQGHEPRTCSRGRCPGLSEPSGGCTALPGSVSPRDQVGDTHTHLQRKRARGWVGSEVHAATVPPRPGGGVASGPPAPAVRFIAVSWLHPHRGGWRDVRTLPHRRSPTAAQRVPAASTPAAGPGGDSGAVSPGPHSGPRWCWTPRLTSIGRSLEEPQLLISEPLCLEQSLQSEQGPGAPCVLSRGPAAQGPAPAGHRAGTGASWSQKHSTGQEGVLGQSGQGWAAGLQEPLVATWIQ